MLMAYIRAYDFYGAGHRLVLRKTFAFLNGMVFFTEPFSAVFQPFSGHICVPPLLKVTDLIYLFNLMIRASILEAEPVIMSQ